MVVRGLGWLRLVAIAFAGLLVGAPSAAAATLRDLPVPRVAIYPGDVIGDEMLALKSYRVDPNARLSVFDEFAELRGKIARRTLLPGQLIPLNAVKQPDVVTHGRPVSLVYEADGLVITGTGVALQSGAIGDFISVRSVDSGSTIKGVVAADGTVRLGGF